MANPGFPATMALETLLFKATNPANKLEDVNTIKQFCDAVSATPEGPTVACRILAHKIQSPQVTSIYRFVKTTFQIYGLVIQKLIDSQKLFY